MQEKIVDVVKQMARGGLRLEQEDVGADPLADWRTLLIKVHDATVRVRKIVLYYVTQTCKIYPMIC